MSVEAQRAARRAAMPITSALLDEYAEFSPKVIYAKENGISVGKRETNENCFDVPKGYGMPTSVRKEKR